MNISRGQTSTIRTNKIYMLHTYHKAGKLGWEFTIFICNIIKIIYNTMKYPDDFQLNIKCNVINERVNGTNILKSYYAVGSKSMVGLKCTTSLV